MLMSLMLVFGVVLSSFPRIYAGTADLNSIQWRTETVCKANLAPMCISEDVSVVDSDVRIYVRLVLLVRGPQGLGHYNGRSNSQWNLPAALTLEQNCRFPVGQPSPISRRGNVARHRQITFGAHLDGRSVASIFDPEAKTDGLVQRGFFQQGNSHDPNPRSLAQEKRISACVGSTLRSVCRDSSLFGRFIGSTGQPVHVIDCMPQLVRRGSSTCFHLVPLKTNKKHCCRNNNEGRSSPLESRAFKSAHLVFYFLEILFGSWLVWRCADFLGTLDWRTTSKGFLCWFIGTGLVVHGGVSVTQKLLTGRLFSYYNNYMANVLGTDKQIAAISALCEGSSIRSVERQTGIHRDTIMRLGVRVGKGCTALMDAKMQNLGCTRLEMDEVWGFIGKKDKHVRPDDDPQYGDAWTFCAIDSDTKLVPAFKVVKYRDVAVATEFMRDVADRTKNRLQISTDGLSAYVDAIDRAFGRNVDYGQIIKTYGTEKSIEAQRKYSAPRIEGIEKKRVFGDPNFDLISTSYVERLNATTRLHMRRLTRLTLAFSKKRENFEAAVGLHFGYYNFVRRHNTLRMTPAMAAGVEQSMWTVGNLLEAVA